MSVLSQVRVGSFISVPVSPASSLCLTKLTSLCTEGDNNTPPNPPLAALLTQSIPHGVKQVVVAKLPLPWQRWLLCDCDVSQVLSGSGGSNKRWPLLWIMSQTLLWRGDCFCSWERAVRGHLPIILECVREMVSGQVGKKSSPFRFTLYYSRVIAFSLQTPTRNFGCTFEIICKLR